nr:hypothetical protein [Candidatus Sigynarchaeota archaeon]
MAKRVLFQLIKEWQKVELRDNSIYHKTVRVAKYNNLDVTMEVSKKLL